MKTVLIIVAIFVSTSLLFADIINVPADTSTIQGGIYLANDGDTVLVAEDTYYENINFIGKAITVTSEFIMDGDTSHISKTVIDGSKPSHPDSGSVVVFISGEDSTSILSGFTITNGTGTLIIPIEPVGWLPDRWRMGGGIFIQLATCTIENNRIIKNVVDASGKEYAGMDGGICAQYMPENHHLIIRNNYVALNYVESDFLSGGGGIDVYQMEKIKVLIENNIIEKNIVKVNSNYKAIGGGIAIQLEMPAASEIIIRNNIISKNELHCPSSYGAGIYVVYSGENKPITDLNVTPIIYNNIIEGNYTDDRGAALTVWQMVSYNSIMQSTIPPRPAIINNTIVNNHSKTGNGLYCYNGNPLIMNNIFWDDLSDINSIEFSMGPDPRWGDNNGTATVYNSIVRDGTWDCIENTIFSHDPMFDPDSQNLSLSSPCIGMGMESIVIDGVTYQAPANDFNGNTRPNVIDNFIDIGAFESPYVSPNLLYPKSLKTSEEITYLDPKSDYLRFTSDIYNPNSNNINVFARITSVDNVLKDSVELYDDGAHNDGEAGDYTFGGELEPINMENEFKLSLGIKNNDIGSYTVFKDNKRITTVGKIAVESHYLEKVLGTIFSLNLFLKNEGKATAAENITVEVVTTDTNSVFSIVQMNRESVDIPAGQNIEIKQAYNINFKSTLADSIPFTVKIFSNGYHFWTDSHQVVTTIDNENQQIPKTYSLAQNYPNPFNPSTTIDFTLPKSEFVTLRIYNILGEEVATLLNDKLQAGSHTYEFDGSDLASGIYMYRIEAGEYSDVKKMILLR